MSFRIIKDVRSDTTQATQIMTIPTGNGSITRGSIDFDPTTNLFMGNANRGQVPLSDLVISTINVGVTPAGIAITPDGSKAYIANNNNYAITYEGGAKCDSVTVIDLATKTTKLITDPSFNQPYTITISPNGATAYVTNSAGSTITIINVATDTVTGTIVGFDGPSGMVITPNGLTGYVNNYGATPGVGSGNGTTVRVVNLNTNTIVGGPITVGQAPAALAISPNGSYVYSINYMTGLTDGTISVIQTSNNSSIINAMSGLSGPFGIALNPSGTIACVTNFGSNNFTPIGTTVSIISLSNPLSPIITNTFPFGIQPSGVSITPDGKFAYISNYNTLYQDIVHFTGLTAGEGTVNIINLDTLEVLPITIVVGQSPNYIAISLDGSVALVSNFTSNTVSIIALM